MPDAQDPATSRDADHSPQPPTSPLSGDQAQSFSLTRRQEIVASELHRLDPQLAGLFRLGLELAAREDTPGLSYLVAEAGRELGNGAVQALAAGAPALSSDQLASIAENDINRGPIARMLRLHPRHPLVSAWAEMNRRFNTDVHLVPLRSTPSSAAADFCTLAELLVGRLAPYFNAQDEADALLAIDRPGPEHINPLRSVLVRPALRTYFMRSIQNPQWLPILIDIDAFSTPPSRSVHPDGSWSTVTWLEGEYLARIAEASPERVTEILLEVPTTNDNPAVWDALARAANSLPSDLAAKILSHILLGLRSLPLIVLPTALVKLAAHVAPRDSTVVIKLLDTLLWLRRPPPGGEKDQSNESGRFRSGRYAFSTTWLLARIDAHDVEDILGALVTAIPRDGKRALAELLGTKLVFAIRSVDSEADENSPRMSSLWCRDLEGSDERTDVRCMLLRAFARTLLDLAKESVSDAAWVVEHLNTLPLGIKTRLRYYVAARTAPHLLEEVSALLSDPKLFNWELPGREVGELLRRRFEDADLAAQSAFAQLLERGPTEEEIEHYIEWMSTAGRDSERDAAISSWQSKHLRRFGPKLPMALQPLAERIGFAPGPLDPQDIGLTEDGSYSGGASWIGEVSPFTPEELRDLPPKHLAEEIANWVPINVIDAPTIRGLDDALESATIDNPERGLIVAREILTLARGPRGLPGILRGLRGVFRGTPSLSWADVGGLVAAILRSFPETMASEWEQVRSDAVNLIDDSVEKFPAEFVSELIAVVEELVRHPSTWQNVEVTEPLTMDAVLSAGLNTAGGRTTEALIRLTLRSYNVAVTSDESAPTADRRRLSLGDRLHKSIGHIIKREGRSALGARATLGSFLPQLVWFAPEWWAERASQLVGDGVIDPTGNPIWSTYLARGRFYDQTFRSMRPWYAIAAKSAAGRQSHVQHRTWEPERHLVEHALIAVVRGAAHVGETDAFVENAVNNVPVEDRAHAYWSIFRGWADAEEKEQTVGQDFAARLVQFWDWRISQLEQHVEWADRNEEADGLLWFCLTPFLPSAEVIRLGTRTLAIAKGKLGTLHSLWERFAELALVDPDGAFGMVELGVELELNSPWPMLQVSELEPVFRIAFADGSTKTHSAALRLLNRLGDEGFSEFGTLRPRAESLRGHTRVE